MVLTDEPVVDIGNSAVVLACTFALDCAGMQYSHDDTCLDNSGNCNMDVACQRRQAAEIVVAVGLEQAYHQSVELAAVVAVVVAVVAAVDLFI